MGHGAVRHVVHLIVIAQVSGFCAEGEDIGPGGHVPVLINVRRVHGLLAVHQERIGIEFSLQRGRCVRPHSAGAFLQVCHSGGVVDHLAVSQVNLDGTGGQEISRYLHRLGLVVHIAESDGMIRIDFRGHQTGAGTQGLLGLCSQRHTRQRC